MDNFETISNLMERCIHKYMQTENRKRHYGTDSLFSRAEIHTIAAIGDMPNSNLTSLAKFLGITKGAASQMVYKLVDKGAIKKEISPNSDTEICLTLTEMGKKAYASHQRFHENANERFFNTLRDTPEEIQKYMIYILEEFDHAMDEHRE
ncbi:MAG: MarR family winged helix-turn-helix transcriptional regulator [bacterium]|nr:MarR family winged helix-turn-helix transcriptional regulator [bacterium]